MAKNIDHWLTKAEAAAITGLSIRALERLIEDGTIPREYRKQPGKRSIAVLDPDAVETIKREAMPITPTVFPAIAGAEDTNGVPALRTDPISRAVTLFLSVALPRERAKAGAGDQAERLVGLVSYGTSSKSS